MSNSSNPSINNFEKSRNYQNKNKEKHNFEFKYKHDNYISNRLIRSIEKLSFDIPKEEKILNMFVNLNWGDVTTTIMFSILIPVLPIMFISMTAPWGELSIIALFSLPISIIVVYLGLLISTKRKGFNILLLTDKSVNIIKLIKPHSVHTYLPYERVSKFLINRKGIEIFDKNETNYIQFSMSYNQSTFLSCVRRVLSKNISRLSIIEQENKYLEGMIKNLNDNLERSNKIVKKDTKAEEILKSIDYLKLKKIPLEELSNEEKLDMYLEESKTYEVSEEKYDSVKRIISRNIRNIFLNYIVGIPIVTILLIHFSHIFFVLILIIGFGSTFLIIFTPISLNENRKLKRFSLIPGNKLVVFDDRLEITGNLRTGREKDVIPFSRDLIIEPVSLGIYKLRDKTYKSANYPDFDVIDIYSASNPKNITRLGSIENIFDFYLRLELKFFNWLKEDFKKENISEDVIFNKFINTDDFNKRLYNTMKMAIQNFLCDSKRSSYRFKLAEPIMKKVEVSKLPETPKKQEKSEIIKIKHKPLKELKDLPVTIDIPEEVINPDCGPETEADKIRTKDLLGWNLQYTKEYYRCYIDDYEKILYAYHPDDNKSRKILFYLFFMKKIDRKLETYRREIIFTEKKILHISYFNTYFTGYHNISKLEKFHNKSPTILKSIKFEFKKSVPSSRFATKNYFVLWKVPLNSPMFAIIANKGIPIHRSD